MSKNKTQTTISQNLMDQRLTVLLPLKGRPDFTLRFLWYANHIHLPYKILIADGEFHPELSKLLENAKDLFPNLAIEYVVYTDDANFGLFQRKMADAVSRVTTPYVVVCDNDDFPVVSGIERSLEFLDSRQDYICCGGGLGGFAVHPRVREPQNGLLGRLNRLNYRYTPLDKSDDFGSTSALERIREGARNWWSYYAVFRVEAFQTVWKDSADIDFSDLQLLELFQTMRILTLGKARSDGSCFSYVRQYGTSMQSAFRTDWVDHLLQSSFTTDFKKMVGNLAESVSQTDQVPASRATEEIQGVCGDFLRSFLRDSYGEVRHLKEYIRNRLPGLVSWHQSGPRLFVQTDRNRLLKQLSKDGASPEYIHRFRSELNTIEETFSGQEFSKFVLPHLTALMSPRQPNTLSSQGSQVC